MESMNASDPKDVASIFPFLPLMNEIVYVFLPHISMDVAVCPCISKGTWRNTQGCNLAYFILQRNHLPTSLLIYYVITVFTQHLSLLSCLFMSLLMSVPKSISLQINCSHNKCHVDQVSMEMCLHSAGSIKMPPTVGSDQRSKIRKDSFFFYNTLWGGPTTSEGSLGS